MAEYTPETIHDLINRIDAGRVVLPAMQRNFVWSEDKICKLFESIMRDYPIGTFLFWKINQEDFSRYCFNKFICDYDEFYGDMQRGDEATAIFSDYDAVLDGQQRITSLYIGVKGEYRTHIKGKSWDDRDNFIPRYLCIDIMAVPDTPEAEYRFAFKPIDEINCYIVNNDVYEYWMKVADIFSETDISNFSLIILDIQDNEAFQLPQRRKAIQMVTTLYKGLHIERNVNYYSAQNRSLSDVVDIFVRVNSGGEKLDPSDLMLSVAAGQQEDVDIHKLIAEAVNEINSFSEEDGIKVNKEMVLTAGLLLIGADSLSLKDSNNYTPARMNEIFKDHWDTITDALKSAVNYIEYLGFSGKKLSKNLVLPIAYYFYKNQLTLSHKDSSSNRARCDRVFIRQWILRATINGIFDYGTRAALLSIRRVIDDGSSRGHFPLEDLLEYEVKPLKIEDEQVEDILAIKYGDPRIRPLFNELEHVMSRSHDQVDHIWARAILTSKKEIRKRYHSISDNDMEQYKSQLDRIANLQLLDGLDNNEKSDTDYDKWLETKYPSKQLLDSYRQTHFIPDNVSYDFTELLTFMEERKELLRAKIKEAFPSDFNLIVEKYNLQDKI